RMMKLFLLVVVAFVVFTSANVIREEMDMCAPSSDFKSCLYLINSKREENLNLAEIVANIGKVINVIDGFVN
ncbi:hypothetical protein BgiMline_034904, partial [Biomphalaria glabrata]